MEENHREFYSFNNNNNESINNKLQKQRNTTSSLINKLIPSSNIIGNGRAFSSPFGERHILYADYVASGKALHSIENYIADNVLPLYANTHTTASITGIQSSAFRNEARQIIGQSLNVNVKEDVVLFVGSGSTAAINRVIGILGLKNNINNIDDAKKCVIFVGPHEHHSNLLPWRETGSTIVEIKETKEGLFDLNDLKEQLHNYKDYPFKIGTFSLASNLTGIKAPEHDICELMHRNGGLVFFDCATAGPYMDINMNPVIIGEKRPYVYKDGVFLSPHKMIGGPNTPGILVIKKKLLSNKVPTNPGGGTVFFVTSKDHRYLSNRIEREEGGTPDIIGSIRAGLCFHLKHTIGTDTIHRLEQKNWDIVYNKLKTIPNIHILGGGLDNHERLPVLSFLIEVYENKKKHFLHYNFVCSLLNDLYGIQSRGGCQCAGPYAQRLLSLTYNTAQKYENELIDKKEYLRPGFSRLSFPYFMETMQVEYICNAITNIAKYGWRLLPLYKFIPKTGEFKHVSRVTNFKDRIWLSHIFNNNNNVSAGGANSTNSSSSSSSSTNNAVVSTSGQSKIWMETSLKQSIEIFKTAKTTMRKNASSNTNIDQTQMFNDPSMQWFLMPSEARDILMKEDDTEILKVATMIQQQPEEDITIINHNNNNMIYPKKYVSVINNNSNKNLNNLSEAEEKKEIDSIDNIIVLKKRKLSDTTTTTNNNVIAISNNDNTAPQKNSKKQKIETTGNATTTTTTTATTTTIARKVSKKYPLRKVGDIEEKSQLLSKAIDTTKTNLIKNTNAKLFPTPPKKLMRVVGKAIAQWDMIQEGDRLCLGLSGGKDSLALLHVLHTVQKRSPKQFTLAAATVDPGTEAFNPRPLIGYLKSLNIPYHFLSENIFERASCEMEGNSICSYCSRMKRGTLYTCCRKNNYNVLVLAQHLDDLAESFMMSALHNGQIRTMKANYTIGKGDIRVIRPFVYTRESQLKEFSYNAKLPVINENCPACFEAPKERHRIKKMLAQEESLLTGMYGNLKRALIPLMDEKIYDEFKNIQKEVDQRGKKRVWESSKRSNNNNNNINISSGSSSSSKSNSNDGGSNSKKN